jgi:hypothetical protein
MAIWPLMVHGPAFCESKTESNSALPKYLALPLTSAQNTTDHKPLNRYGIPFIEGVLPVHPDGTALVSVGGRVKRIFLRGMTESAGPRAWSDPNDYSARYFIGDNLGQIRVDYADGSTQMFPLILGESVWWGQSFYQSPDPFPADARLRNALASSMHLYPAAPVEDGNYVAVIVPNATPLRSIKIESSPAKKGSVVISGITVECAQSDEIVGAIAFTPASPSPEFEKFAQEKALRRDGMDESEAQPQLDNLRRALYTSNEEFRQPIPIEVPHGYVGPQVFFKEICLPVFCKMLSMRMYRTC